MIRERIKPMTRLFIPLIIFLAMSFNGWANRLLIPMDESQKNHLKAYGISYWILKNFEMGDGLAAQLSGWQFYGSI